MGRPFEEPAEGSCSVRTAPLWWAVCGRDEVVQRSLLNALWRREDRGLRKRLVKSKKKVKKDRCERHRGMQEAGVAFMKEASVEGQLVKVVSAIK